MAPARRWSLAALGVAASLVGLGAGYAAIRSRSQAILDARHPATPSAVRAATSPEALSAGEHLTLVTNCRACHGKALTGGAAVSAPNLTLVTKTLTDPELDRAIRHGLRPDGRSELGMPSRTYAAFTDQEMAEVIGYLRSLKPQGIPQARARPGFLLRANLVTGAVIPEALRVAHAPAPVELGAGLGAGRHLAAVACGQCHGTDLHGGKGLPGPDLTLRGYYDRAQFHTLMRTGVGVSEDMELMSQTALASFSHFTDPEVDSIFDYLIARDQALAAKPGP